MTNTPRKGEYYKQYIITLGPDSVVILICGTTQSDKTVRCFIIITTEKHTIIYILKTVK